MKKIEGYVSKKVILYWLENYEYLQAKDTPPDAIPTNSGPKSYDGVSANQLNKVMLDQAIDELPKLAKACIKSRYVYKIAAGRTCSVLDISKDVYYDRCKLGVDLIYQQLNGERANYKKLLEKIIT
jgi:DNA-directed RNA polymerase specialized sigma24 family protein